MVWLRPARGCSAPSELGLSVTPEEPLTLVAGACAPAATRQVEPPAPPQQGVRGDVRPLGGRAVEDVLVWVLLGPGPRPAETPGLGHSGLRLGTGTA